MVHLLFGYICPQECEGGEAAASNWQVWIPQCSHQQGDLDTGIFQHSRHVGQVEHGGAEEGNVLQDEICGHGHQLQHQGSSLLLPGA